MAISDADMPQLFCAADRASFEGQREYLRVTRVRLALIVGAAACGIGTVRVGASHVGLLALLGLILFVAALLAEIYLWSQHPERDWYDGRALAESVKTLTWKFAVGGEPFPVEMPHDEARRKYIDLLDALRTRYKHLSLDPIPGEAVTAWMDETRSLGLPDRRDKYLEDRVLDQQSWYAQKANTNRRRARQWRVVLLTLELLGAATALVEATTRTGLMFSPTVAALVGATVAWLETKQHDQLARAYGTTVSDLGSALSKLKMAGTEADWAREMNDAEDGISREHTLWLASRSLA